MVSEVGFRDSLESIADRVNNDMSERDVENLFLEEGFYDSLGYEGTGVDIRSEFTLPDERRPDYITLDGAESVSVVYEFKNPTEDLSDHEEQLFHYVKELQADFGVLTNGKKIRVFKPNKTKILPPIALSSVTEFQVRDLVASLQKREYDLSNPDNVNKLLAPDTISLHEQAELGQEHFFDTFRLEEGSPFADLVVSLMDVLQELRDHTEGKSQEFVQGAYDFWEATYASEPDEIPDSWEAFVDGKQSLRDFMFSLETGHALLSRLLLAKATEDHDFFERTAYDGMDEYFRGLQGFSETINLDAFPIAAKHLIDDMQEQLVEALFQDDIFVWWTEGYEEGWRRGHKNRVNQFESIAEEDESDIERLTEVTRTRFNRSVAMIFFNILRFDFTNIQGDLLGDLYQRYFDPETRKALGEFYTPQPVVDYIMDGVDYNRGISNERLIDPACGSGTFLVEAVERYIEDVEEYSQGAPDWETKLQKLCTQPHIVGLDIHPFAVLMAQIRFVVAILPAYRKAKNQNRDFTLRRLPIYRTDTLRNERELTGVDVGGDDTRQITFDAMTESDQDVLIPVPLPIEVDDDQEVETEDGFLVRRVRIPLFDTVKEETDIRNFGEYFAALQGVLDTVKDHMQLASPDQFGQDYDWTYQSGLEKRINQYATQEYDGVGEFFKLYVNDMLENVQYLKEEHNDGRLFKMLEDAVLALVVKNYMEFEYAVGNPPYVSSQNIPSTQKKMLDTLYPETTTGQYDLYCPFFDRSLEWLKKGAKLGFITPNQFLVADYGRGVRRLLQDKTVVEEVQDFRDSGVFKDATNYPLISILRIEENKEIREENTILCGRVKSNIDEDSGRELDEQIVETIRRETDNPGYSDEFIDVFEFPQSRLSETRWPIMPESEWEIFTKIKSEADTVVGGVTDAVFQGIMTGKKGVYVVEVLDEDIVTASNSGDIVTISPTGDDSKYDIETDLLRPFIDGKEVERWQVTWGGLHIVHPYHMVVSETKGETAEPIGENVLSEEFPKTYDYLTEYKSELEGRSSLRDKKWYEYSRPQNLEKFERPKLILSKIADEATYMSDTEGTWYFTTPYSVLLDDQRAHLTSEMTAQLNSNVLDFYFKHISAVKAGGFYEYLNQYITPVPCMIQSRDGEFNNIRRLVEKILSVLHTENKIDRFPEAYIGEYEGELDYINYEWQTRRYPVDAEIRGELDGEWVVQAGRSDKITDPAMYSENASARKNRAQYVQRAVDGRNIKRGEETTIPIPRSDEGVSVLLDELRHDENIVDQTHISEIEAKIDSIVYDLFNIKEKEQVVIEEYLETF